MKSQEPLRLRQDVEELHSRVIDVAVWGASRPHLFKQTIESFRDHAKFSGGLRFFLEDGNFNPERAKESVRIAEDHHFNGINVEKVGSYGYAMTHAMDRWIRAPLMFTLEDDWLCLRDIDLNLCFDCFEQNSNVNQIRYNKRKNSKDQNEGAFVFADRVLNINGRGYPVQGSAHWYFNPSVWRMKFIRPRWRGAFSNVHFYMNSMSGLLPFNRPPSSWYADVLGAYIWGAVKEPAFFRHIGTGEDSIHKAQGRV